MICYKDKTFCLYAEECEDGDKCGRKITDEDRKKATDLNLGICYYTEQPNCFKGIVKKCKK